MAATKQVKKKQIDLNPSSADRWTTCTASPGYIFDNWELLPPDTDTKYNKEGTTAHEVAAALLEGRKPNINNPYDCPVPVTPEMNMHAWNYMEYVESFKEGPGSKVLVEQRIPLWYMPHRNAKVDSGVINPHSLHVFDYKYGVGIIVDTQGNKQAVIYVKSIGDKLNLPDNFPVFVHIYQPRGRAAEDSPFHVWETTWGEIQEIAKEIDRAAHEILVGGLFPQNKLAFAPSEKACQWCPAKGFCVHRRTAATSSVKALANFDRAPTFDNKLPLPSTNTIGVEQISKILQHGKQIIKWLGDVEDYALELMKGGGKVPGYKLVESRAGNRFWTNEDKAGKLLLKKTMLREQEVYEKKVISVASLEKLLGKKIPVEVSNLISRPAGKPVIAPEDDKRESLTLSAESEFSKVVSTDIEDF